MILDKKDTIQRKAREQAKAVKKAEVESKDQEKTLSVDTSRVMYLNAWSMSEDVNKYIKKSKLTAKEICQKLIDSGFEANTRRVYYIISPGNKNKKTMQMICEVAKALGYDKIEIKLGEREVEDEIDKFFQ